LLIITGSMGAGKSSVLAEASDLLRLRDVFHAAIDLDALCIAHLPSTASSQRMMYSNLQVVCENYASVGVTRLLLARAIEDRAELELCRQAVSAANAVICRLTASIEVMQERVKRRESGLLQDELVTRVAKLNAILDAARLEDFTVSSQNRSVNEVASEALVIAGWIPG
jgi:hypothetical protein